MSNKQPIDEKALRGQVRKATAKWGQQTKFANAAGVSSGMLSEWIRGRNKVFGPDSLARIEAQLKGAK
jgi:DNA-binding transcriptional regulator YdaS (Cro superfamily)